MAPALPRILVTGGSGYIGSAVVRLLAASGFAPTVFDVRAADDAAVAGATSVRGDVRDRDHVASVLRQLRPEAVVHVAGIKSVAESNEHPERYFSTNTVGTLSVLEAMAAADVRQFIFSSSAAIYGSRAEPPVKETAAGAPDNAYGESKLQAERLLPWFETAHGIRYLALRYFNAAGASPDGRFGESWTKAVNLLPVAMRAAAGGPPLSIFGNDWPTPDGTAIRDYIHIDDLAAGHVSAIRHLRRGLSSDTLNLGTGSGASVREVIAAVERAAGRPVPTVIAARRPGDPAAVWADVTRARRVLGWTATRGLDQVVEDAWRFHVTSRDPVEDDARIGP